LHPGKPQWKPALEQAAQVPESDADIFLQERITQYSSQLFFRKRSRRIDTAHRSLRLNIRAAAPQVATKEETCRQIGS
jgi:hypothetical protein